MRPIISNLFMSLDGVVEQPGKWSLTYWNDDVQDIVASGMADSDAMLLGRVTYEEFAGAWSGMTNEDDPGAAHMNGTRKYVVSSAPLAVRWANSSRLDGPLEPALRRLKATEGREIMTSGSPTLVRALLRLGLVDELRLLIYPVVVGHGVRLFDDSTEGLAFDVARSTTFDNGVHFAVYQPRPAC